MLHAVLSESVGVVPRHTPVGISYQHVVPDSGRPAPLEIIPTLPVWKPPLTEVNLEEYSCEVAKSRNPGFVLEHARYAALACKKQILIREEDEIKLR